MRRPSVQPQPPLQGARPSPAFLQSPPKVGQARQPKNTRKQWGTRWVQETTAVVSFSPWLCWSLRSSFLSLPGEERLELSLWGRESPSTPAPLYPALDLWLIKPFPNNVFCVLILFSYGPLLPLFCFLVASSLDLCRISAPSTGTVPSPCFWCLILRGEWKM